MFRLILIITLFVASLQFGCAAKPVKIIKPPISLLNSRQATYLTCIKELTRMGIKQELLEKLCDKVRD